MAVVKLTKSKKAVQFIDENGIVFQTSAFYLQRLLDGDVRGNFILLARLPFTVAKDRFKPSPLYGRELQDEMSVESKSTTDDILSVRVRKDREEVESFKDKEVGW